MEETDLENEIRSIIAELHERSFVDSERKRGCTQDEIDELQALHPDIPLPEDYVYFLREIGGYPCLVHFDIDLDIRSALFAEDIAQEMVDENSELDTSGKLFMANAGNDRVFYFTPNRQGVFSMTDASENNFMADSFSSFLRKATIDAESLREIHNAIVKKTTTSLECGDNNEGVGRS